MNFMLEVTDYTKPIESFADRLSFGGLMVIIGMLVVFAVLILIWGCLSLFKIAFADIGKKTAKKDDAKVQTVAAPADDEQLIAAIAAAIAAAESESDGLKFRVVSFKRK